MEKSLTWRHSSVISLIMRDLIPVAGIFFAGWNVGVVAYLFWFEAVIIFCIFLIYMIARYIFMLMVIARTSSFISNIKFILGYLLTLLFMSLLFFIVGSVPGFLLSNILYSGLDDVISNVSNPLNPIIFFSRSLDIVLGYQIGLAIVVLCMVYIMEVCIQYRVVLKQGRKSGNGLSILDVLEKGFDRIEKKYKFRITKVYFLSFLMAFAAAVANSDFDTLELGRWAFFGIIILKIIFDASNLPIEQSDVEQPVWSNFAERVEERQDGRILRTNRGQIWQPRGLRSKNGSE